VVDDGDGRNPFRSDPATGAGPARPVAYEVDVYLGLIGVPANLALIYLAMRAVEGRGTGLLIAGATVVLVQVGVGLVILLRSYGHRVLVSIVWLALSILALVAGILG
jgi:hypothetical protein